MGASSRASHRTSSTRRSRRGFFHAGLAGPAPSVATWISPTLREAQVGSSIAQAFHDGGRVLHVCLEGALHDDVARRIHEDLEGARFRRHHHAAYPIDIASREEQDDSALTTFVDWLGTDEAAAFHFDLCRWPMNRRHKQIQVQTSRMTAGDHFPLHIDTEDEGLAAIYHLSIGLDGGELFFPRSDGADDLVVPPRFNTLMLFRPRGAIHGVRPVPTGGRRYSITTFYLVDA